METYATFVLCPSGSLVVMDLVQVELTINILKSVQNVHHFVDEISKCNFFNEK